MSGRPPAAATKAVDEPTSGASSSAPRPPLVPRTARLLRLATIWGAVRFEHPYLYDREVDWDGALVRVLPKVNGATTEEEEAAAIQSMLAELHDPLTQVEAAEAPAASTVARRETTTRTEQGVVVFTMGTISSFRESDRVVADATKTFAGKLVVIDLRGPQDITTADAANGTLAALAPHLVSRPVAPSALRWVQHEGFAPQTAMLSAGFSTTFVEQGQASFTPVGTEHPRKVAFIVDDTLGVPAVASAMQEAGDAIILTCGAFTDAAAAMSERLPVGEHHQATVRRAESVVSSPAVRVDDPSRAVEQAVALLLRAPAPRPAGGSHGASPRAARAFADPAYPLEAFPPVEHRILAAFRLWNVLRFLYPYRDALNDPATWSDALADVLPRFENATTELEYEQAIAALAARVHDSHVGVQGARALRAWMGDSIIDAEVRFVEGRFVVAVLGDRGRQEGLALGDELVQWNGEDFAARVKRLAAYVAASNPWTSARSAGRVATACAKGSRVVVGVRGGDERVRQVGLSCDGWAKDSTAPPVPYRLVEPGVGYVDLGRLGLGQVDAMFAAMAGTRALILDMRAGPSGTTIPIAARLNEHAGPVTVDRVAHPLVAPRQADEYDTKVVFSERLPSATEPHYPGRTVVLIDERTQSSAETTAEYFRVANGSQFIGSPSAGADGSVTRVVLPGNVTVTFTGSEMTLADGSPLQRVGLQPDILARPTLHGLRQGQDEVLDRALAFIRAGQ